MVTVAIKWWKPDTCYCEFGWDEALPAGERPHIVRTCQVHTGHVTPESHYNTVVSENQHKSYVLGFIQGQVPDALIDWRIDRNRHLIIEIDGLDKETLDTMQQVVADRFPGRTTTLSTSSLVDSDAGVVGRRKPHGELASLQIRSGSVKYVPIAMPDSKEEIEQWVLHSAIRASNRRGISLYNLAARPVKNPEDDIDFTLTTTDGTAYLDVMEVVLLKGSSYAEAPTFYSVEEMATQALKGILRKSANYKAANPIHLLLYSTDWRFILAQEVLDLVGLWLHRRSSKFATVTYTCPTSDGGAILEHVFPRSSDEFNGFDEQGLMNSSIVFGDFSGAKVEIDGTVTIPVQNPLSNGSQAG